MALSRFTEKIYNGAAYSFFAIGTVSITVDMIAGTSQTGLAAGSLGYLAAGLIVATMLVHDKLAQKLTTWKTLNTVKESNQLNGIESIWKFSEKLVQLSNEIYSKLNVADKPAERWSQQSMSAWVFSATKVLELLKIEKSNSLITGEHDVKYPFLGNQVKLLSNQIDSYSRLLANRPAQFVDLDIKTEYDLKW